MKPSIPKGTRDFSPETMNKRNHIFDTIKNVYHLFGYQPIETPAMENLSTLTGKYGEEGDQLLFKILNSGDYLSKVDSTTLQDSNRNSLTSQICEKGLRYDLTVPFARYVVQNRNDISFPFKRYQIQPVWRADKPQKGRYREFYQCDADVIGSNSLMNEVELLQIIDEVFNRLNVSCKILINSRKILCGIAEYIGHPDKLMEMTIAIDKLDKIGSEKVQQELSAKGFSPQAIEKLISLLNNDESNTKKIDHLQSAFKNSQIGHEGIEEIKYLINNIAPLGLQNKIVFDINLARGLNYYTGTIIEVKAENTQIGSICGGGRYDNLTGVFGLKDISGVGISFGADRIYDVMQYENLFPKRFSTSTHVLFINFDNDCQAYCLPIISQLRKRGVATEIYPDYAKLKKQMTYANNKHIPYVAIVGEHEMKHNLVTIKNMETGEQSLVSKNDVLNILSNSKI